MNGARYTEIKVKLPVFAVMLIPERVRKANARGGARPRWTVSLLLERWLLDALTVHEMDATAAVSPAFKRAAEAWLKGLARRAK